MGRRPQVTMACRGRALARYGFGRLFNEIDDAVVVADVAEDLIVLWNRAASQIFGYSHDEAGLPLHRLVPPELRDRHLDGVARFLETNHGSVIDAPSGGGVVGLRADGSRVDVELRLSRIAGIGNGAQIVLAIIRDVSERKAAEAFRRHLEDSATRRRHALEINDDVVQGLAAIQLALDVGDADTARVLTADALARAKRLVSENLAVGEVTVEPGFARRGEPALGGDA